MRLTALVLLPYLAFAYPNPNPALTNAEPANQNPIAIDEEHSRGVKAHHPEIPSWQTTHFQARRMFALSSEASLATVFQPSEPKANTDEQSEHQNVDTLAGNPIALPEYYADCIGRSKHKSKHELLELVGEGNPVLLGFNIGTAFRNAAHGSNASLQIDWWHHKSKHHKHHHRKHHEDDDDALIRKSLANLPRLSIIGYIEPLVDLTTSQRHALEKCFVDVHPDTRLWLPGHEESVHGSYWARLVVEKIFWIGGFGDRARIGWLDPEMWHSITKKGSAITDGIGWADVRLPGEK